MLAFLENQWVVGIGAGIISGIIVYFITKRFFQRKDNSKHLEQINSANMDIIRILKPYVAEKGLPEKEIIDAIILSTSRKYNVKSDELYSIRIVCEELIREIIENVYVSSDKKKEYSNSLKEYLLNLHSERDKSLLISDIKLELKNSTQKNRMDYMRKMSAILSATVSGFAAILTMLLSFFYMSTDFTLFQNQNLSNDINIPLIVILVSLFISLDGIFVIILIKQREHTRNRKSRRDKNNK